MPATNVKKAEELKPDLILLDIGLPGIRGIEAVPATF
jgi:CheY-like chemotaxis protein